MRVMIAAVIALVTTPALADILVLSGEGYPGRWWAGEITTTPDGPGYWDVSGHVTDSLEFGPYAGMVVADWTIPVTRTGSGSFCEGIGCLTIDYIWTSTPVIQVGLEWSTPWPGVVSYYDDGYSQAIVAVPGPELGIGIPGAAFAAMATGLWRRARRRGGDGLDVADMEERLADCQDGWVGLGHAIGRGPPRGGGDRGDHGDDRGGSIGCG